MRPQTGRRVLISGCGIAGPALAYWLLRYGFLPTIVERAPQPRESGYMIDFWGAGFTVAERMGLLPRLRETGYDIQEVRLVDGSGRRVGGFPGRVFRAALGDRFVSLPRGDLAKALYDQVADRAECVFGDSIAAIEPGERDVRVTFEHGASRTVDLVIGADGLHSAVRRLTFGGEDSFERFLGYQVAAFNTPDYPHRDQDIYVSHSTPGRQIARYSLRDGRTGLFMVFRDPERIAEGRRDVAAQKALIRSALDGMGWETPDILRALEQTDDLYFDSVSQIRLQAWSRGRVALLGDAAFCPSLVAGEGSSMAMAGAYLLAGELKAAAGGHRQAFERFERMFRPLVERKQVAAEKFADWFAPRTATALTLRNLGSRVMSLPVLGPWMVRRMLRDEIPLPAPADAAEQRPASPPLDADQCERG
ncbi:MAG: FAD-binding domain [Alphaproteobacteria bacterium]|nr:FAD-binding domain [Alphaproteobacteria bacterium]